MVEIGQPGYQAIVPHLRWLPSRQAVANLIKGQGVALLFSFTFDLKFVILWFCPNTSAWGITGEITNLNDI